MINFFKPQVMRDSSLLSIPLSAVSCFAFKRTEEKTVNCLPNSFVMHRTFTWTYNVIRSCNNGYHFEAADTLIALFEQRYGDSELALQLRELRESKWASVHSILI